MTVYGWLIFAPWLTLVAYWGLKAATVKRTIGTRWLWWREIAVRLAFFALVVLALQVAAVGKALPNEFSYPLTSSTPMGVIGFVLCVLGIVMAILGRASFAPDWSSPESNDEDRELIMTGPYALVRHPIYGGMLLAMLGSAIGQSVFWLLPLSVYGPQFILTARREERFLIEQSPERYRAYMKRTKMLLPFVL